MRITNDNDKSDEEEGSSGIGISVLVDVERPAKCVVECQAHLAGKHSARQIRLRPVDT